MAIISLVCKQCGGAVDLDDSIEFGICSFCGTKLLVERPVVNNIRNVYNNIYKTGDGKDFGDLINDAMTFMDMGKIKMANETFKKAIELQPDNWLAWSGFATCGGELIQSGGKFYVNSAPAFKTAYELAEGDDKNIVFAIMCEEMTVSFDRETCDYAIALRPNDWRGYFALEHGRKEGLRVELMKAYKLAAKAKDEQGCVIITKHAYERKKVVKLATKFRYRDVLRAISFRHKKLAKQQIRAEAKEAKLSKRLKRK